MSRSHRVSYELEKRRRLELEREQAAEMAEKLLERFQAQLEDMQLKGYSAYIPEEMDTLKHDLESAQEMLIREDPISARNLSRHIGAYIGALDTIANCAISQYERAERIRSEQVQLARLTSGNALLDIYYKFVGGIDDPILVNCAAESFEEIRQRIELRGTESFSENELLQQLSRLLEDAKLQADKIREAERKESEQAAAVCQIDTIVAMASEIKIENAQTAESFSAKMSALKKRLHNEELFSGIAEEVLSAVAELDDAIVSESVRREAVRAIYMQLKRQEFTVEPPKRIVSDGTDCVRIVAKRPSGKQAVCEIDNCGSIRYKFDHYEGMTCLKDIERFNIDLESIYSINLSDERVIWSNPDRLSKDSNQVVNDNRRSL